MAAAFVQALFTGSSKTAGASLAITGSKTITVRDTIFVAFASDDVGSAYSVTDNLGNIYTSVKEQVNTGAVKTRLWRAPVTVGGTLTTQTISWTTNATAKAAVSAEFSGVGSQIAGSPVGTNTSVAGSVFPIISTDALNTPAGGLAVGAAGFEAPSDDATPTWSISATTDVISNATITGTIGGGATSNISVSLIYTLGPVTNTQIVKIDSGRTTRNGAGAGAIYNMDANVLNPVVVRFVEMRPNTPITWR